MNKVKAISSINSQLDAIPALRTVNESDMAYLKWKENTISIVKSLFGEDSNNYTRTYKHFHSAFWASGMDEHALYIRKLDRISSLLDGMITEIYMVDDNDGNSVTDSKEAIEIVLNICNRFHQVARQIGKRHDNRPTIMMKNEYDVQDLLHALLEVNFDDIRAEEWTPSCAGGASRMDFLLKQEKIVIEVKMTRKGLGAKEVGDQLAIDIQRYQVHPDCETLICFVYDPESRVVNPVGIENDLNSETEMLKVITIITPK